MTPGDATKKQWWVVSSFTLVDLETDVLEGGVVAALGLSQDLRDVFHFGALELQRHGDSISGCVHEVNSCQPLVTQLMSYLGPDSPQVLLLSAPELELHGGAGVVSPEKQSTGVFLQDIPYLKRPLHCQSFYGV